MKVRAVSTSLEHQPGGSGAQLVLHRGRSFVITRLTPRFTGRQG